MADIFYPIQMFSESIVSLMTSDPKISAVLNFFIYDSIKIIILLFVLIALIGYFRTYVPPYKIKKLLSGRKTGIGNVMASLLGAVTPFCSCSSIPIFIGLIEAGVKAQADAGES